jgi:hypothetical protein
MAAAQGLSSQLVDMLFVHSEEYRALLRSTFVSEDDVDEAFSVAAAMAAEIDEPSRSEAAVHIFLDGLLNQAANDVLTANGALPVTIGVELEIPELAARSISAERSARHASERWGEVADAFRCLVGGDPARVETKVMHTLFAVVRDGFDEDASLIATAVAQRSGLSYRQVTLSLHKIRKAAAEQAGRGARKTRR